ncbi:hypothetical protein MWU57_12685 [Isoptericola sp. S6320L]|uniref:hypothetical protein n=1 Tax=Isoptericola sp. S6320L TaxID=2926411 RepID=UPI001FF1F238|nr:hypothetical protein [Isoptericola sp. S6320L]MCK0117890.1 hypothetical protein [Isoptericola sp. S6320L]
MTSTTLYGLSVDSDVPMPSRPESVTVDGTVRLRRGADRSHTDEDPAGEIILRYASPERPWYTATRSDDGYRLRFHGTCDFVLTPDLEHVTLHAVEGADSGVARVLASGAQMAFQLYLRGHAVLHASAVQLEDDVVGFVGRSGMGKSTMAALLCAEGGALVTDDVLRVDPAGDDHLARLGATELRLRKGADTLTERFGADSPRRGRSADGRDLLAPGREPTDARPVGALVVPLPDRTCKELRVDRVRGGAAAFALMQFPRLLGWRDPRVTAQQFARVSALAASVPVFTARVPWGPPFRERLGTELVAALRAQGAELDQPSGKYAPA